MLETSSCEHGVSNSKLCRAHLPWSCTLLLTGYFLAVSGENFVCMDVSSLTVNLATDIYTTVLLVTCYGSCL